ncbi:MAG: heavy metal-responsive transcriptional regulator [Acidobacteria bacterium]|nr:heavy metal-responsive transcriptional regulator [Acidobacteriota bacterium]
MRQGVYRIGDVAKELGLTPQALRYYEQEGLIPKPQRTPSGYRIFSEDARARLLFLKRAQQFGFKLDEIKTLLGVKANRRGSCAQVKSLLDAKLVELEERFKQIKQLQTDLLRLRKECEAAFSVDASCPVIIDFAKDVSGSVSAQNIPKRRREISSL